MRILLPLLLLSTLSFGQLEVKETTNDSEEIYSGGGRMSLNAFFKDSDTSFAIYFQDLQYKHIVELAYIPFNNKAELMQFFELVEKAVSEQKEFDAGVYSISKGMNKKTVSVWKGNSYTYFGIKTNEVMLEAMKEKGYL